MSLNLRNTIYDFLKSRPDERFTGREIAQWIFDNNREACEEKRSQSKQDLALDADFLQQLAAEISTTRPELQKKHPKIKTTESRPRQYFYSTVSDESETEQVDKGEVIPGQTKGSESKYSEHDLYPLLSSYLFSQWGIHPKRIDEKRASNRKGPNGNKWLFPDLVGVEDLSADWGIEVKDCVNEYGDKRARLWSFEVKLELNRTNVRESLFQAVSNSSWANFGYLVARDVIGDDTMKELRILSAAHGIGLMRLNTEDPAESVILIPAKERTNVDWDACNRLASESTDFKIFIKMIRKFHQTGELSKEGWDIPK